MLKYPDLPNHESWTPNLAVVNPIFAKVRTDLEQTPDLNWDEFLAKLKSDLEAAYKAAP